MIQVMMAVVLSGPPGDLAPLGPLVTGWEDAGEGSPSVPDLLERKLQEGEAVVWFLGHSGWAVKTREHFLIFDYWRPNDRPPAESLATGGINPEQLKDQNVLVVVSHSHGDHYDRGDILPWRGSIKQIRYVFGWQVENVPEGICLGPREQKRVGEVEIRTIKATDAGVGYCVDVDGLTVIHGGDHACWNQDMMDRFTAEIDYLAEHVKQCDLAFLAITGGTGERKPSITEGVYYAARKLRPKVLFPMHANERDEQYRAFADEEETKKLPTRVMAADARGDAFLYQRGAIRALGSARQ